MSTREQAHTAGMRSSMAVADVLAERRRQVDAEGWTPEHDDQHSAGELADAAAIYARFSAHGEAHRRYYSYGRVPSGWPWDASWWKPTNPRRDLVKAGALILAEIERLDRIEARATGAAQ